MRNLAVRLEYDGTRFVGSQLQANGRSVQGELEQAWLRLSGETARWTLAGRTDSGVHALGQVANVRTSSSHTPATVLRALNALLPDDLSVHNVWEVAEQFHARFSARRREYRYLILNNPTASAILRQRALLVRQPLDIEAMDAALSALAGEHDFSAFAGKQEPGASPLRFCFSASCRSMQQGQWRLVCIDVAANAFLRNTMRIIAGTALQVGAGSLDPAGFAAILAGRDRRRAGPLAQPHGLYLMRVLYDPAVSPREIVEPS